MLVLKFRRVIILNPIVKQCTSENDNIEPLRTCHTCGLEAHTEDELKLFVKKDRELHGCDAYCKSCRNEAGRIHRKENKEYYAKKDKRKHCKRQYGITSDEYDKRMSTSDVCEVCGAKGGDTQWQKLCYDHDHTTMKFRGVLCNKCNLSIGQLGDTLESVQKVVTYLSRGL